jgi:hypothetical protein
MLVNVINVSLLPLSMLTMPFDVLILYTSALTQHVLNICIDTMSPHTLPYIINHVLYYQLMTLQYLSALALTYNDHDHIMYYMNQHKMDVYHSIAESRLLFVLIVPIYSVV